MFVLFFNDEIHLMLYQSFDIWDSSLDSTSPLFSFLILDIFWENQVSSLYLVPVKDHKSLEIDEQEA